MFLAVFFEREGRDSFDYREDIVRECRIRPGMAVATSVPAPDCSPECSRHWSDKTAESTLWISLKVCGPHQKVAADEGLKNVVGVVCSQDSVNLPDASIDLAFVCDTVTTSTFATKMALPSIEHCDPTVFWS